MISRREYYYYETEACFQKEAEKQALVMHEEGNREIDYDESHGEVTLEKVEDID